MISAFEMFKIGIGPSSSHTVGPMIAALRFRNLVKTAGLEIYSIDVEFFGSLAWTGRGHSADTAVCLGLLGYSPDSIDPGIIPEAVKNLRKRRHFTMEADREIRFDPDKDLLFNFDVILPGHANGMRFRAFSDDANPFLVRTYYSIGGGFVVEEGQEVEQSTPAVRHTFHSADDLLSLCKSANLSIADVQWENECMQRAPEETVARLDGITDAMFACIDRGLATDGILPGGLNVRRRAMAIHKKLLADRLSNQQRSAHEIMDWVSAYAIAVNEENAAGGKIVTAPTNGAAGVVPAVLRYYREFCTDWSRERERVFLLTAAAIGGLIKRRASISGAEVGCQGEVGAAAAMAAAGLAAALGATPTQVENAAEIAIEHHLGMTCDPIGGLVQVPCIERNALGANKAIVAASLAMRGDGHHRVTLDEAVETMRQTGADMQSKYKETSRGGLAVNVAGC